MNLLGILSTWATDIPNEGVKSNAAHSKLQNISEITMSENILQLFSEFIKDLSLSGVMCY